MAHYGIINIDTTSDTVKISATEEFQDFYFSRQVHWSFALCAIFAAPDIRQRWDESEQRKAWVGHGNLSRKGRYKDFRATIPYLGEVQWREYRLKREEEALFTIAGGQKLND